ncbi:MAG: imidazole glycerol phosphate synthase subunit HisH [Ignavibacteriales bacterium]
MIGIIDYGAGNTASVENVLLQLGYDFKVVKTEFEIINCEKIILPGVGEASFAIKRLHLNNLVNYLRIIKKPLLGICLGMQLLADSSQEGNVKCLGIIDSEVKKFQGDIKIPHMGWNSIEIKSESKLLQGIESGTYFYFANSFYLPVNKFTVATTNYLFDFTSVAEKENYYGVQFHPEKSGENGIRIIKNFVELC